MAEEIRLAKFLAQAGVASRRKAEDLILAGKVKVGGQVVQELATLVSLDDKDIKVNNKLVVLEPKVYYLLNKPIGYICSVSDPHNKKTVLDLVPKQPKVVPVGRLDKDSQGLLLLTNDGDLTHHLTHPKFEVKKTYIVKVNKKVDKNTEAKLRRGINMTEGLAKADQVKIVNSNTLEIIIHQGWKRQIRRMLEHLGYQTKSLTRIAEGKIKLGDLQSGKYKKINKQDLI